MFPNFRKNFPKSPGERIASGGNPHEHDVRRALVALGDFMGDARESAANGCGIQDDGGISHGKNSGDCPKSMVLQTTLIPEKGNSKVR
jgi:hypothetical protein